MSSSVAIAEFEQIDHNIRVLHLAERQTRNTVAPETLAERLAYALTIYAVIRPILTGLSLLSLLPPSWRKCLTTFVKAVDAVSAKFSAAPAAATEPPVVNALADTDPVSTTPVSTNPDFKAGKDL